MKRWRLGVDIVVERVGVSTVISAVLLLVVLAGAAAHLAQLKTVLDRTRQDVADARARAAEPGEARPRARTKDDTDRFALFEQTRGKRTDLDAYMRAIFAAARRNGIALNVGEYRLVIDDVGAFARYNVSLPVEGTFRAIQQFGRQVLAELPFAALEELSLKRESAAARDLAAHMRFVLYVTPTQVATANATEAMQIAELLPRKTSTARAGSLFESAAWVAPPPRPPPAPPPPSPRAPQLPFAFIGKRFDGARWEVFVGRGADTLIVRENDLVDGTYRIETIHPPLLSLVYLPLNERQTLAIGPAE
jgi:hypothetical protein